VRTDALRAIVGWPVPDEKDDARHQVFDLRADPGARTPLAPGSAADRAFDLIREAVLWCEAHRATAAPEGLSGSQMETLRQMGYTGERAPGATPADDSPR
jgi:hypothetical protein